MKSLLFVIAAAALVASADAFAATTGKSRSSTALHAENRRVFLSTVVMITGVTSVNQLAFAVDDLAMPTASEQRKLDEVRSHHRSGWTHTQPLDSTLAECYRNASMQRDPHL